MKKKLKYFLLILCVLSVFALTACSADEDEMVMVEEAEVSSGLTATLVDGEGVLGEMTDDLELGSGFDSIVGTDHYDPDNPFKITRSARPIRKIEKQDVYGNMLTDDFYFYRNNLSKSEKNLYDQIYANAIDLDPNFKLTTKIHVDQLEHIMEAVRYDNPDLFWLSLQYQYSYDDNDNVTDITLEFYDMENNIDDYKAVFYNTADSVLEYVMDFEYQVDQVKYVHDLLTNINTYEFAPFNQSAYSAMCTGKTVCAGYTYAFQYFMQRLGIPAAVLVGDAGERHAWAMVQLDGEYYEMDVTWDDPIGNDPNTYYYNYFNLTTSEIASTRSREAHSSALPKANGTKYSFENWYGDDPGRNFSEISWGKPNKNLPPVYPGASSSNTQTIEVDVDETDDYQVDDYEEVPTDEYEEPDNDDNQSDREKMEMIIEAWSDEEWDEFWDQLAEELTQEELEEVDQMDWDEFIDVMTYMYFD